MEVRIFGAETGLLGWLGTAGIDEALVGFKPSCVVDARALLVSEVATVLELLGIASDVGLFENRNGLADLVDSLIVAVDVQSARPGEIGLVGLILMTVLIEDVLTAVELGIGSSVGDVVLLRMGQTI